MKMELGWFSLNVLVGFFLVLDSIDLKMFNRPVSRGANGGGDGWRAVDLRGLKTQATSSARQSRLFDRFGSYGGGMRLC
jgi:hypothetical protein